MFLYYEMPIFPLREFYKLVRRGYKDTTTYSFDQYGYSNKTKYQFVCGGYFGGKGTPNASRATNSILKIKLNCIF